MSKNGNKNSSSNKGGNSNKSSKSSKGNNRSRGSSGYDPSDFDDDINMNGMHWHTADDL